MTRETEITIAIMNNVPYLDFLGIERLSGIALPYPQTSGTMYQKETYARIKAREIIERYKLSD